MVLSCLWTPHFKFLILLTSNLFVWLSMRSSNQRTLNQLRMRKPRKILLHQLLVSSPFTIMLIDGTLILPEMRLSDITKFKGRTSDRPTEQVIEDDWKTSDDPKRALDKFWKGRTEFTLISVPTGKRLEGKQSTLPVVQDLSKSKSSKVTSTSADQKPTSDSAMFESETINFLKNLLWLVSISNKWNKYFFDIGNNQTQPQDFHTHMTFG